MPKVNTKGLNPHDQLTVRSIMLFPGKNEAQIRRQFYAADLANGTAYQPGLKSLRWPIDQFQALLEAPSWVELKGQVEVRTKRATVAAYIYLFMFFMDRYPNSLPPKGARGASLSKARHIAERYAKDGAKYGDGSPMLTSSKSIKDCWREFKDVAHFWASMEVNKAVQYAPPERVLYPENHAAFLRTAAYLQAFGLTHVLKDKAASSGDTLLDPATAWLLDMREHKPQILLPVDAHAFDDAPFIKLLRSYKA